MLDIIREAALGQAIRFISRNKLLLYPEEKPDFKLPPQYVALLQVSQDTRKKDKEADLRLEGSDDVDSDLEMLGMTRTVASIYTAPYTNERLQAERTLDIERVKSLPIVPQKTSDGVVLVDWYTTDDSENPQNWSSSK